jgi:hypothetical protein
MRDELLLASAQGRMPAPRTPGGLFGQGVGPRAQSLLVELLGGLRVLAHEQGQRHPAAVPRRGRGCALADPAEPAGP